MGENDTFLEGKEIMTHIETFRREIRYNCHSTNVNHKRIEHPQMYSAKLFHQLKNIGLMDQHQLEKRTRQRTCQSKTRAVLRRIRAAILTENPTTEFGLAKRHGFT